jgi:hypothetical protein
MSLIENSSKFSNYPDHTYDRFEANPYYDLFPKIGPYFNKSTFSEQFPKENPKTLFEKQIEDLTQKCGLKDIKFQYVGNESEIRSFGTALSVTQPILMGPIKAQFSNLDKFLLAKELHKIKNPDKLLYILHLISRIGYLALLIKINPLHFCIGIVFFNLPYLAYENMFRRSNVFNNDLAAASTIGLNNAIKALEDLKKTKQDSGFVNWFFNNRKQVPTYEERIQYLKQNQEAAKK